VIELCFNLIEGARFVSRIPIGAQRREAFTETNRTCHQPDVKSLQIQLTGFLDKDTAPFCKELWKLLLSAQTSPQGVPKELLEAKKLELIQEKVRTLLPEAG
jgi:serine/arginine repetitive matrix protein 1